MSRKLPYRDKGTPTYDSPWPDEPVYIAEADAAFAIKHGGALTRSLVEHAQERGYLDADPGWQAEICVRCTWVDAGEQQHVRDEWHKDNAEKGWIYIDGVAPTEVLFDTWGTVQTVPLRTLFPYHGIEHRAPKTKVPGWRYFFRILHTDRGCFLNQVLAR